MLARWSLGVQNGGVGWTLWNAGCTSDVLWMLDVYFLTANRNVSWVYTVVRQVRFTLLFNLFLRLRYLANAARLVCDMYEIVLNYFTFA